MATIVNPKVTVLPETGPADAQPAPTPATPATKKAVVTINEYRAVAQRFVQPKTGRGWTLILAPDMEILPDPNESGNTTHANGQSLYADITGQQHKSWWVDDLPTMPGYALQLVVSELGEASRAKLAAKAAGATAGKGKGSKGMVTYQAAPVPTTVAGIMAMHPQASSDEITKLCKLAGIHIPA